MKKIFVLFLLTVFSFIAHTETGYRGLEWYTEESIAGNQIDLYSAFDETIEKTLDLRDSGVEIKVAVKTLLGERSLVNYFFTNIGYQLPKNKRDEKYKLVAISYIVPKEKTNVILKRFPIQKLVNKYIKCRSDFLDFIKNEYFNEIDFVNLKTNTANSLITSAVSTTTISFEKDGQANELVPDENSTETNGTLYIYDYNDDTRVYIYDNIIKDKAVVVYVPHEQDY